MVMDIIMVTLAGTIETIHMHLDGADTIIITIHTITTIHLMHILMDLTYTKLISYNNSIIINN